MFDFIELKDLFLIGHLLGLAIGAGGAFMSDLLFFKAMRDKRVSAEEMGFLTIAGRFVFFGLFIAILTGVGLVMTSDHFHLDSPKFLAKMTIVAIILINGLILHKHHLPWLKGSNGKELHKDKKFPHKRKTMLISGAISFTSWISVIVLGALHDVPYSYPMIMAAYIYCVVIAILVAILLRNIFIPAKNKK